MNHPSIQPRELTAHKVNPLNESLTVLAIDEPGPGRANHLYVVRGLYARASNPSAIADKFEYEATDHTIIFQNGPVPESGANGLTHEILLNVVLDRLQSFQRGPFGCRENAIAITKLEEALMWLKKRTGDRMERGVEGTMQK